MNKEEQTTLQIKIMLFPDTNKLTAPLAAEFAHVKDFIFRIFVECTGK